MTIRFALASHIQEGVQSQAHVDRWAGSGKDASPGEASTRDAGRHTPVAVEQISKSPGLVKLTNTEPFAAWFVVTGDATADEIRIVRSVLGAISSLPIAAGGGAQTAVERIWHV